VAAAVDAAAVELASLPKPNEDAAEEVMCCVIAGARLVVVADKVAELKVALLAISVLNPADVSGVLVVPIMLVDALLAGVAVLMPEYEMVDVPDPPAIENCPL